MKNKILLFIGFLIPIFIYANEPFTFVGSVNGYASMHNSDKALSLQIDSEAEKGVWYSNDYDSKSVTLTKYNSVLSVISQDVITLSISSDYNISDAEVLFLNNDDYDFVLGVRLHNSSKQITEEGYYKYAIFDKGGKELQTLLEYDGIGGGDSGINSYYVVNGNGYFVFLLYRNPAKSYIYSFNVSTSSVKSAQVDDSIGKPFPNPTADKINIACPDGSEGVLFVEIYTLAGELVDKKIAEPYNGVITLFVNNLESGQYIYKVLNVTGKFIVK